jgi:microcin C transport system substrate-binding protein
MSGFAKDDYVAFRKVKDWWGYAYDYNKFRFNADALEFRLVTGGPTIARGYFYKGEYDAVNLVNPLDWADAALRDPVLKGYVDRYTAYYVPKQGMQGVFLNTRTPLFADIRVRRGLGYALNIQKMIDTALHGDYLRYQNVGIGHAFAGRAFDDDTLRVPGFDPVKAAELFAEAGFSAQGPDGIRVDGKGRRLSFELLYGMPSHTERLSVLREEAKLAGVDIKLRLVKTGAYSSVRLGDYEAYWGELNSGDFTDYRDYIHSSTVRAAQTDNFSGWSSPETDALTDRFRAESSTDAKAAISRQIQKKILDAAIIIPGYYVPFARAASWKWVRYPAWLASKYRGDFTDPVAAGYMWIDDAIKDEVWAAVAAGTTLEQRAYLVDTHKSK